MVTNCDVISEIDYGEAIDYHKKNNADATMIVNRHEIQNPFGVVETKENKFLSYTEKPIKYENISAGIYIFEVENFKYLKHETYVDMPQFFTNLVKKTKKSLFILYLKNGMTWDTKKRFIKCGIGVGIIFLKKISGENIPICL